MLAIIDFLNSREDAILFWTVALLSYVIYKDPRKIGAAFLDVFRALTHPKLLLLFGSAALYASFIVYGAWTLGLWHTSALKATIYWFIGTAVILVGDAVSRSTTSDPEFLPRIVRRVIGVTLVIEFIVNVYAFPFIFELVLTFIVLLFVGMQAVVQHDNSANPQVRRFIDGALMAVGVLSLSFFLLRALTDLEGFLTRDNAENFLVGPVLTLALIPFLYGAAWLSRWEQERLRKRWRVSRQLADTSVR